MWRRARTRDGNANDQRLTDLQAEVELLRSENMRLCLEQQQPVSVDRSRERVRDLADSIAALTDDGDDAWHALAQAHRLRESLLGLCAEVERGMQTARLELQATAPLVELDRRRTDRRATERSSRPAMRIVSGSPGPAAAIQGSDGNEAALRPTADQLSTSVLVNSSAVRLADTSRKEVR